MSAALLYVPRPVDVRMDAAGRPVAVRGIAVEAVREEWLIEDRWWAADPISRLYFEVVLADGRCEVIFRERGRWFAQRA
ncbi:MAG TPA: hypothetical protein VIN04_15275 [Myxococcota bacterium]